MSTLSPEAVPIPKRESESFPVWIKGLDWLAHEFQSLKGSQNHSRGHSAAALVQAIVPIPKRESESFPDFVNVAAAGPNLVPIPKRESESFPEASPSLLASVSAFQSLKGSQNHSRSGHLKPLQDWIFKVPLRGWEYILNR